jgi:hypothetical protein
MLTGQRVRGPVDRLREGRSDYVGVRGSGKQGPGLTQSTTRGRENRRVRFGRESTRTRGPGTLKGSGDWDSDLWVWVRGRVKRGPGL